MKVITTEKAIEYLNKVLDDWGAFCKTHTNITEAIKIILAENENLKEGIKRQKAEIEKLKVEIDRNTGKYIINARNEGIRDFADKVTQNKDSLFNLMYSEIRFKREIYKLANELIKGRTEKNKSMEMNFKITGFKMNGENAVGMVDENGFTFSILDKTGQPIPLNKENIESFLKDNKAKAEKGFKNDR